MITKKLDDINEEDILALISGSVSEGRTIEYKRQLPANGDSDKKEFLADISSFANSGGGDLVFGLEEDQGVPTQIVGVQCADIDLESRRLESIIASGLDPRIRYSMRAISCSNGPKTLVIRIERSWSGPHRVIFKGHDKFYGRNSAGKYPLDVGELRTAFTLSSTVTERIRAFRTDRIIALSNNETPVPLPHTPKIVLHCIPLESFSGQTHFDVLPFYQNPLALRPMGNSGWDRRLNLDGLIAFSGRNPYYTYTQLYRNGIIEAVDAFHLADEYQGDLVIPSVAYEREVFQYLPSCFQLLEKIGATVPIVIAVTLIGTRGLKMGVDSYWSQAGYPIESDTIILPETVVNEFSVPVGKILKPLFDLVWNACGYPESKNFDAQGNWVARR
jgi:hypothetical protein